MPVTARTAANAPTTVLRRAINGTDLSSTRSKNLLLMKPVGGRHSSSHRGPPNPLLMEVLAHLKKSAIQQAET
jgi:hypothetical protein